MKNKVLLILLLGALILVGCGTQDNAEESEKENNSETTVTKEEEIFSNRDFKTEYEEDCAFIQLDGTSASCESNAVEIKGSTVTIKDEGTYIVSGSLENGMLVVDSEDTDKTQIVLKGVAIHNDTSAAIYIKESDKVFLTLEQGTENVLSNGGTFDNIDDNSVDGVIFSKSDLTLNGAGTLTINSPGGHGIVSKDDLIVTGGSYQLDVAAHGLSANDMLGIAAGDFNISSKEDAVHCDTNIQIEDGDFEISAGDDAIHADETLNVCGGNINISNSYEGLEALDIKVTDGAVTIVASDDGINAAGGTDQSGFGGIGDDQFGGRGGMPGGRPGGGHNGAPGGMQSSSSNGSVVISGGTLYIQASGDGIDANGSLEISGGHTTVCGPTQGDTATLDYDTSATISGGTFIGTGAMNMAQTFSDSEQGVISVSVGNQAADTLITLTDAEGNTIVSYAPALSYAVVIISSEDIEKGKTYTITVGDASAEFEAE